MPTGSSRSARLTDLQTAVKQWADSRRALIDKVITSHKKLLASRGNAASRPAQAAEELVVDEITDFLS